MSEGYKRLSSTVLEMKFMQRTKRKIEAKERKLREAEMRKQCFENEEAVANLKREELQFQFSNNLTYLQSLKFGRMSFKGCNPEVEKLMAYHERKMIGDDSETDSEDGKDVGDLKMARAIAPARFASVQKLNVDVNRKHPHHRTSMNESSAKRLNFTDVRKRGTDGTWTSNSSRKKIRTNR